MLRQRSPPPNRPRLGPTSLAEQYRPDIGARLESMGAPLDDERLLEVVAAVVVRNREDVPY